MRWMLLPMITACVACTNAMPSHSPAASDIAFAIPNPQRPGAKAPACPKLTETADGCTFHTNKDDVNRARLPAGDGASWIARTADSAVIEIRAAADETSTSGARYQVIELVPTTPGDADIAVTFDKLTGEPGARKVVERRRVNVMIHAVTPAAAP